MRESRIPSSEGLSGISTPPDHAKNRRGALFLVDWLRFFSMSTCGELIRSTLVNDTPLAIVFSLAGCFAFYDMNAEFCMQGVRFPLRFEEAS